MFRSKDRWEIVFYNKLALINKLKDLGVEIYNFFRVSQYKYSFETLRKKRKIIKNNFKDCKIKEKKGVLNYLEILFISKTTMICLVVASLVLDNVSRRIWKIEIIGDYLQIEENLKKELVTNQLFFSNYYPNHEKLKKIENTISLYLTKEIEWLEIKRSGSVIIVRYQKRREAKELPSKGLSLYATKNGMIRYFNVQNGVKMVKEYDYVRKGDLLVSDMVETSDGELINVGTLGSVFANTFYVIDVNVEVVGDEDEASVFSKMLDKAKLKISSYLSKDEKIEKEKILNYSIDKEKGFMKVYYMLLEDITI